MHYIVILSPHPRTEIEAAIDEVGELVSRFLSAYPDHEGTFAEPALVDPKVYAEEALAQGESTPEIEERLRRVKSALAFEGPADPQENAAQVSVLKLCLKRLEGSVIDWGGIDYGWPLIQSSEEGLAALSRLPDEPRIEKPDE